jgi:hypothetical protein
VSTALVKEGINVDPREVWIMSAISLKNKILGAEVVAVRAPDPTVILVAAADEDDDVLGSARRRAVQNFSNFSLRERAEDECP